MARLVFLSLHTSLHTQTNHDGSSGVVLASPDVLYTQTSQPGSSGVLITTPQVLSNNFPQWYVHIFYSTGYLHYTTFYYRLVMKKRHNLCCTALALPFQTLRRASQARLELFLPALPFDTPRQASMACLASSLPAPPFQMLGRASQARLASVLPVPPFHTPRRACKARLVFLLPPPSISTHQMSHDGSSGVLVAPHISSHPDEP